ncbi:hypothetical protein [Rhizobium leguminosarum]|uniref:hypothetical protein n=1 Tax=Rhizobium leguminosarum TaxID=384 RepID=UPI001FEDD430|nr:hypothetical protein [Rhizobium leguminosarum]
MGIINLTDREKAALKAIDENEVDKLIDQAVREESLGALHRLPLHDCGAFVATKLRYFGDALREYNASKSSWKREETYYSATRAGTELRYAFSDMKQRLETEEKNAQLFHVDDHIPPPYTFSRNLTVRVSYRWRKAVEDGWTYGSIAFHHVDEPRLDYLAARPKRKPSAAKQAQELQAQLGQTWEHLCGLALYTIRDYFEDGGMEAKSRSHSKP